MEGHAGAVMIGTVKKIVLIAALLVAAVALMVPGATMYYESGKGARCTSCHEMQAVYDQWHASSHRGIACEKCHGGALTTDASFHMNNVHRRAAACARRSAGSRSVSETAMSRR